LNRELEAGMIWMKGRKWKCGLYKGVCFRWLGYNPNISPNIMSLVCRLQSAYPLPISI
jgi:hypothetical protein